MAGISDVLKQEQGNSTALNVLSAIVNAGASAASQSNLPEPIKVGATVVNTLLPVLVNGLNGGLNPDNIDLEAILVESPEEQLQKQGIDQAEIDSIINTRGMPLSLSQAVREAQGDPGTTEVLTAVTASMDDILAKNGLPASAKLGAAVVKETVGAVLASLEAVGARSVGTDLDDLLSLPLGARASTALDAAP